MLEPASEAVELKEVDELQKQRTRSLHIALDKLVSTSK